MRPQWRWHRLIVGLAAFTSALFLLADFTELVPYILCAKGLRKECSSTTKVVVQSSWVRHHRPERQQPVLPAAAAAAAAGEAQPQSSLEPNWSFNGVQQCVADGDPDACAWCNSTFAVRYPLMAEHLQRAFIPGQPCSMPPGILERLQSNQSITIAVIGGSMTAGHGCFDQHGHGSQCAWPAKMQHRLQETYPHASITVKNLARPGFSYTDMLSTGHIHTALNADVLLIDLQVNSQVYNDTYLQMESVDDLIYTALALSQQQQRHLGIMFVESFRTCSVHQADCNKHCRARQQGHHTYNHTGRSKKYSFCNKWWTIASFERPVVRHYGLPIVSYRDAVWPDISTPSPLLPCFWNGLSHPDAIGHAMMADVVTHGFLRAIGGVGQPQHAQQSNSTDGGNLCTRLQPPVKFHQQSPSARYCTAHDSAGVGTFMSAEQPDTFQPVLKSWCWRLFEDKPGKPGWTCQSSPEKSHGALLTGNDTDTAVSTLAAPAAGAANATMQHILRAAGSMPDNAITFRIRFSAAPQLQLTYLTSYTGMGAAEVALYAADTQGQGSAQSMHQQQQQQPLATVTVDSAVRERFSIPRTSMFVHPSMWQQWQHHPHAHQLPADVHQGEHLVMLRPVVAAGRKGSQKFKLLSLSSC